MKKIKAVYRVLNTIYKNGKQGMTSQEISKELEYYYPVFNVSITTDDVYGIIEYHIQQGMIGYLESYKEGLKNGVMIKYYKYFITEKGAKYAEKRYGIIQYTENTRKKKRKRFGLFAILLLATTAYYLITK